MSLGNMALVGVCIAAGVYVLALLVGMIAVFPFGLLGLVVLGFVGFLLFSVLRQKLDDKENRHYEDNVNE
ncbi:hypothetical protein FF098_002470 [Parvularcula flava]|uniref:Uncharacterized protein n=1 Tax=Aquisalinus luteolus TaxID=1566827 RepID=A0A8J3EP17_9PROT|nr:hypothetical protein [Aquisalinus luteolus]NHK26772.1 hypothetical protein [Aquisalinus luteolus]GGH93364.1 hypothetical protein GCM10011355_05030 [Aquisalinus luteolus]